LQGKQNTVPSVAERSVNRINPTGVSASSVHAESIFAVLSNQTSEQRANHPARKIEKPPGFVETFDAHHFWPPCERAAGIDAPLGSATTRGVVRVGLRVRRPPPGWPFGTDYPFGPHRGRRTGEATIGAVGGVGGGDTREGIFAGTLSDRIERWDRAVAFRERTGD